MVVIVCVALDIFPVVFEGGKLVVNKGLSSHFQISHTMTMSSLQPSGYKFGCTYVGTKQYSPSEASQVTVAIHTCIVKSLQNLNLFDIYSQVALVVFLKLFLSTAEMHFGVKLHHVPKNCHPFVF